MAEKKKPTITNAAGYEEAKAAAQQGQAALTGNATGLRVGAIVLWVAAIVFEILAVLILFRKLNITFMPTIWALIILIVLDLACVIIGAQLWKKANHIRPASEKNKLTFWLWNNMGVIVCVIAFVPFIILLLTNKNVDKKTKAIATVVAVIALLIGGVSSYDWNPVSQEQQQAATQQISEDVYWTQFGHKYHVYEDCGAIKNSNTLYKGPVLEAIESGRTAMCSFCANRAEKDGMNLSGLNVEGRAAEKNEDAPASEAELPINTQAVPTVTGGN